MFNRIGEKIKGVAEFFCYIGIFVCALVGLYVAVYGAILEGILIVAGGAAGSWLGSLTLYGFGELIEQNTRQTELLETLVNKDSGVKGKAVWRKVRQQVIEDESVAVCRFCKTEQSGSNAVCSKCGATLQSE